MARLLCAELGQGVAHFIVVGLQNHLPGHPGVRVDGHGAFQVHRTAGHGLFHHAQHVEAELLAVRHPQLLQLVGLEDGGVSGQQGKGVHGHKGQGGGGHALETEQSGGAALKGQEQELVLLFKAEKTVGEGDALLFPAVNLAEILRLKQH